MLSWKTSARSLIKSTRERAFEVENSHRPLILQFSFASSMLWLNYPFRRGREGKEKDDGAGGKGDKCERETVMNALKINGKKKKQTWHTHSPKLTKEKHFSNYLLPLPIQPHIILRLWPSKSFASCMLFPAWWHKRWQAAAGIRKEQMDLKKWTPSYFVAMFGSTHPHSTEVPGCLQNQWS